MQEEEIGSRTSSCAVGVSGMFDASRTNVGLAELMKCPTNPLTRPPTFWRQDTYGVLPENVMSGRVALAPCEIGAPLLTIWKCAVAPTPTNRETMI